MKILFCGTPEFAVPVLDALRNSPHPVVAALTRPDKPRGRGGESSPSPVSLAASRAGLKVLTQNPSEPGFLDGLKALAPEAAVVAAYGRILSRAFLESFPRGVFNIHPSLLPRWRGASPVASALLAGDSRTGVCVIRLVEELDAGPILAREEVDIGREENRGDLEERLFRLGAGLLLDLLDKPGSAAREQESSGILHCPKWRREDEKILWQEPASRSRGRVRALAPAPGAFFPLRDGSPCKVLSAAAEDAPAVPPGTVLGPGPGRGVLVACGAGALNLLRVRPAGRKDQEGLSLLNSGRLSTGLVLPS